MWPFDGITRDVSYRGRRKKADQRQMKAAPSTGGKTLRGGMFMNAA